MVTYWRRIVREKVLQALYAHELAQEPVEQAVNEIFSGLKKYKSDFAFATELLSAVIDHQDELDTFIKSKAANWQFDRIAIIDMLLLRMGICEFLHFPDIPPKVTINEAIEIAKTYSTEKSGQFINGILDAVLDDLRKNGRLNKAGRGLIEKSPPHRERTSQKKKPDNDA